MWSQVVLRKQYYEWSYWRWWNSSWVISNPKRQCCESAALNMPANLKMQQWPQDWSVFIPIPKKGTKNVQTTIQLCLFHMLPRLCSKSFKLDFSSLWIENFQMYKQGLKKAEEPEMKLPTFAGSYQKQCNSKSNIYFCFHQLCWSFWLCGSQQTVGNS